MSSFFFFFLSWMMWKQLIIFPLSKTLKNDSYDKKGGYTRRSGYRFAVMLEADGSVGAFTGSAIWQHTIR